MQNSLLKKYVGDKAFYKYVLAITLPIMLQNGITQFVNMLDNIMVGRIGTTPMTGVAISNQLIFVFNLCVFGAVSGAGIFGAQFYGKGDNEGMRFTFRFKVLLSFGLLAVALPLLYFGGEALINAFLTGEGQEVDPVLALKNAKDYLDIMLIGLVPFAFIQVYSSSLRETGETVLPMKASIVAVIINLVFNYIFIFEHFGYFGWGVKGAAIATVMSRFVELFIVAFWTHKNKVKNPFIVDVYKNLYIPLSLSKKILAKGLPLMLNEAFWSAGITMLNQRYSIKGIDVVAANNISQTFWNVFSVVFISTGAAIAIIIGQLLGAGKFEEAKDTDRKLIAFSVILSTLVGAVYFGAAFFIPNFYNTEETVRNLATGIMCISACVMPINAFAHASYFTLRSGGKVIITFLFDSVFIWVVCVPVAFVLTEFTSLTILPIFAIVQALELIKCILGAILLEKGVWIRNIVDNT